MTQPSSTSRFDVAVHNPEIMLRHLPADIHATVEQVSANVSQSLDRLFTEFKASIDQKAEEFSKGILPADLAAELDGVAETYAKELSTGFKTEFASLNAAIAQAKTEADAAAQTAPGVQAKVAALAASATALQTKLDDLHGKLKAFGGTSAKLIVGSAVKYVTGGLA